MERLACGRSAGLELLPFINEHIPWERDLWPPISCILVSAFERDLRYFEVPRYRAKISGVLEREKVDVLLIGRMKTGNTWNLPIEVVVPDLSSARLVNRRQLD